MLLLKVIIGLIVAAIILVALLNIWIKKRYSAKHSLYNTAPKSKAVWKLNSKRKNEKSKS